MLIGANILWNTYWNTQPAFVDLFGQAEPLFVLPNGNWSRARAAQTSGRLLTESEMPVRTRVMSDTRWLTPAHNIICFIFRGDGDFHFEEYDRLGELSILAKDNAPARCAIYYKSPRVNESTMTLIITRNNNLEILGLVPLEWINYWRTGNILHPEIEAGLTRFRDGVRFMDWCGTFITGDKEWRNPVEEITWSNFEYITGREETARFGTLPYLGKIIAKHSRKSWICIPPALSHDGIRAMARQIKKDAPNANLAVEFGNELWNYSFEVTREFQNERPAHMEPAEWYVRKAKEAIEIFENEFGQRVERVVAWQAAVSYHFGRDIWNGNDPVIPYIHETLPWFDVIAIAPYFLGRAANNPTVTENDFQEALRDITNWCSSWKVIADEHQKPLVCYEFGQHLHNPSLHENIRTSHQMGLWYFRALELVSRFCTAAHMYTLSGPVWGLVRGANDPAPHRFNAVVTFNQS